jgi:hypothetical protein
MKQGDPEESQECIKSFILPIGKNSGVYGSTQPG